jgi:hypothetical protein
MKYLDIPNAIHDFSSVAHNEYRGAGYIKIPKKKLYHSTIRIDFNSRIVRNSGKTKLLGFSLRMFGPVEIIKGKFKHNHPEISVHLRAEEWLDLIDTMKAEYKSAQKMLKDMDSLR